MGAAAIGLQGAGVLMSAYGASQAAKAERAKAEYGAMVAEQNASINDYQAKVAARIGSQQEQVSKLNTASMFSSQRTSMAANGIDLGQGTATDVLTSTVMKGNTDVANIQDNTARNVWSLETQASMDRQSAKFQRETGSSINPGVSAATSLLGNAGAFSKSVYGYGKENKWWGE